MKEDNIKSIGAEIRAEGSANRINREWLSNGLGEEAGDFEGDGRMDDYEEYSIPEYLRKPKVENREPVSDESYGKKRPSAIGGDSKIPVGNTGSNAKKDRNLEI